MSDKVVGVRELRINLTFVCPEAFANLPMSDYIEKINNYVKDVVLPAYDCHFDVPDIPPLALIVKAEDITD